MNNVEYQKLRETSWRRRLTPDEESRLHDFLLQHPEVQTDWEEEVVLNAALRRLPNAPVPSNFTSLVLQAVEREAREADRAGTSTPGLHDWFRRFLPKFAWAAVLLALAPILWFQVQRSSPQYLAEKISKPLNVVAALPAPEVLAHFDEINRFRQITAVSDEAMMEFFR